MEHVARDYECPFRADTDDEDVDEEYIIWMIESWF